jgi:MFS family permease
MSVSELSLTLLAFLTGLSFAVVAPVLPLYVESLGASHEVLGWWPGSNTRAGPSRSLAQRR